jgi:hypothetical protein
MENFGSYLLLESLSLTSEDPGDTKERTTQIMKNVCLCLMSKWLSA